MSENQPCEAEILAATTVENYLKYRMDQAIKQFSICSCDQCKNNALAWYNFWSGEDASTLPSQH